MHAGDRAWCALAAAVLTYEVFAPRGELLSEACDRHRAHHPIVTYSVIGYLAAHLTRLVPARVDPLTKLATRFGR